MYGLRALGALPYTGRPEMAVSGTLSRYVDSLSSAATRFATIPNVTFSGDFEIKAVAAQLGAGSNGTFIFAGSGVVGQNGLDLYRNSSGNYQLFINNTSVIGTTTAVTNNITAPDTVIVRRLSGVVDLIINGVSRGTFSTSATLSVERLFHRNGWANNGRMALYEFSVVSGGSYNASWSMANSPSVGVLWVSNNNRALTLSAGWPTDNSQWKQYLDTTVSNALVPQPVSGAIKWYLKWPANVGNTVGLGNKSLCQISGITGNLITVRYTLAESMPAFISNTPRYIFDARRQVGTTSGGGDVGYLLQGSNGGLTADGTTGWKINGVSVPADNLFGSIAADSVCEFNVGRAVSGGCIAFGARFNETEHNYGLAVKNITIIDGAGTHTVDFSDKAGRATFTSTDGAITVTLVNFNEGSCWCPYLDTTVSTPLVNQGVNGTANYFCTLNGTSGFTSPTLGNLITGSPKIKVVIKKFSLKGTDTRVAFWQGALSTGGGREFLFRRNANVAYEFFIGGSQVNIISVSEVITIFGDSFMTCDEFALELDGTTARIYKDGSAVKTLTGFTRGTARLDGALFRIGCAPANDTPTDTTSSTFAAIDSIFGDIQVYINDVLVRSYKMPDNGSTVIDTVAGNNLTQRGTFTIDNNKWRQYIENIVSAVTAKVIKWFNGSAWVSKPIKWFNGTAWVQKTFKK